MNIDNPNQSRRPWLLVPLLLSLALSVALPANLPAQAQTDTPNAAEATTEEIAQIEQAERILGISVDEATVTTHTSGKADTNTGVKRSALARIITPTRRERFNTLPIHIVVEFGEGANTDSLHASLNGRDVSGLFRSVVNGQRVATLSTDDGLQTGVNTLVTHVWRLVGNTVKPDIDRRVFFVRKDAFVRPDYAHQQRRLGARDPSPGIVGDDPPKYFNPSDFSGSQANTRQSFGHGMYIVTGWAALERVISSWFLDAIQPDPTNFADLSRLWRWSEIDWEFVPYSVSQQREHIVAEGTFPNATTTISRTDFLQTCTAAGGVAIPGQYDDNTLAQGVAHVWNGSGQQRTAGSPDTVTPNTQIGVNTFDDLAKIAVIPPDTSTGPYGFSKNPNYPQIKPIYWWTQEHPSFVSTWPLPCSLPLPSEHLPKSVALNVFRMPPGAMTTEGAGKTSTVVPDIDQNSLPDAQPKPGNVTNEAFAWAIDRATGQASFDPYHGWHTYTLLVTPDRIAFYIDAGAGGTDIQNSTPVRVMDRNDPQHPFPTLSAFGPNMIGGDVTFQDYANVPQPMGNLRFMLQNWVDGNGWSGDQAPANASNAYVRNMSFHPLNGGASGTANTDYGAPTFQLDTSTWTSDTARYELMKHFHVLYAGNPQFANTQTTSPGLAKWIPAPDGTPAIALGLVPIKDAPPVDFFVLSPGGTNGNPASYLAVEIDLPNQSYATAAFPQNDVFYGPVDTPLTVKVWFVNNPSQTCTVQIKLLANNTWEPVPNSATPGCQSVLRTTPSDNNTVGIGTPVFGS